MLHRIRKPAGFGAALAAARKANKLSQLDLALSAGVSQRHISFLEVDRATPSREMVFRLSEALRLSLSDQNVLLGAAQFAPRYNHSGFDAPALAALRRALEFSCAKHEPFPALIVDCAWRPLYANMAAMRVFGALFSSEMLDPSISLLSSVLRSSGLRDAVDDYPGLIAHMVRRLRQERAALPCGASRDVIDTVLSEAGHFFESYPERPAETNAPAFVLSIAVRHIKLSLIATIATFAEPLDIGVEQLRLESFYPADEATGAALCRLAQLDAPGTQGSSNVPASRLVAAMPREPGPVESG